MDDVRGKRVTIRFDERRCIHALHCVIGAPKTFHASAEGAWIHPDETPVEELVEIVRQCPSGALTYERHDGEPAERPPETNVAEVREDGPLALRAEMQIAGEPVGFRIVLCRCGASKCKPYCDGSHAKIGFTATGEPALKSPDPLAARDGAVNVSPAMNGPLLVEGNLEIRSATGRVIERTTQAWLCRCGASANKPFCDGSHKRVEFQAP